MCYTRKNRLKFLILTTLFVATISGCEKGLEPPEKSGVGGYKPPYGISGNIIFKNFIPKDSVKGLFVAASQDSMPHKSQIPYLILTGRIEYVDITSMYGKDTVVPYSIIFKTIQQGNIPYIAVVHQFGPTVTPENLQIVGIYYNDDTTRPGSIYVPADSIVANVNINVDFYNLPPQPPE